MTVGVRAAGEAMGPSKTAGPAAPGWMPGQVECFPAKQPDDLAKQQAGSAKRERRAVFRPDSPPSVPPTGVLDLDATSAPGLLAQQEPRIGGERGAAAPARTPAPASPRDWASRNVRRSAGRRSHDRAARAYRPPGRGSVGMQRSFSGPPLAVTFPPPMLQRIACCRRVRNPNSR
jgi:hypothetical protein